MHQAMTRITPSCHKQCQRAASQSTSPKSTRLIESDHVWESYKEEIHHLYIKQDMSLKATMAFVESKYTFKHSTRKWKMKIKDWKFEKHIPANEMMFMAAKADERKTNAIYPKDTIFVRGDIRIMPDRIANFKKLKKEDLKLQSISTDPGTPPGVRYYTPDPELQEYRSPSEEGIHPKQSPLCDDSSNDSVRFEDQTDISIGSTAIDQDNLAQLLFTDWAWVFKHSYSCENGSQLYQVTLQLSDIADFDLPHLQRIKFLAYELLEPFGRFGTTRKFGTGDPNAEILFRAIELASGCSEIGWYDAAGTMFDVLMHGSLATFDRVGRKFNKIRSYVWYVQHQQRGERWGDSVNSLCLAYEILTSTLLFSGNAAEYHKLSGLLKSALDSIPAPWRSRSDSKKMDDLVKLDKQLDDIIADDKAAGLGSSRLNCNSAACSSNLGRYGVTYTESMMSGISFNYSALFP